MSAAAVNVWVSTRSMWQRFHGCTPEFIEDVCHAKCCDAPSRPTGTLITIHPSEEAAMRALGQEVDGGLLVTPERRCPFKTEKHLCALHDTGQKPFGCCASPFTLTKRDTLIVRNRYRMLPCYSGKAKPDEEWPPAYIAFKSSLERLFGEATTERLHWWLWEWGDAHHREYDGPVAWQVPMLEEAHRMLHTNDDIKRDSA